MEKVFRADNEEDCVYSTFVRMSRITCFIRLLRANFWKKNCNDFVTFVSLPGSLLAGRSNLFTVCQFSVCSSLGIVTTVQSIVVGNLETLIGQFFTL